MTKKEQAEVEALVKQVRLLGALRWTSEVKPDVMPPETGYTQGWQFSGRIGSFGAPVVGEAWSGVVNHGSGKPPEFGERHYSASQRPQCLYSTRLLALKALRRSQELQAAEALAKIDVMIEAEETKPTDTEEK